MTLHKTQLAKNTLKTLLNGFEKRPHYSVSMQAVFNDKLHGNSTEALNSGKVVRMVN